MQKRVMGKTGESVSLLGFGCMRFPQLNGKSDMEKVQAMVDYAYENGVNYYDTAYVYGNGDSERSIGQALKKYPRDSFYLADKLPLWLVHEKADLEKLFNTSLERLGTDYIDFYLLHALDSSRIDDVKKYEAIEFFKQKKAEGKIKHIGFSFHDTPETFKIIADMYDWDFVQIQLNYLDWEVQRAKETYEIIEKKGFPLIVMEPIRGGALANPPESVVDIFKKADPERSAAAWALSFCASLPQVKLILSGMSSFDQVKENVTTLADFKPLADSDYKVVEKAVECINAQPLVGCTGCRYCMPCPKGVNIPGCFVAYNDYLRLGDKGSLSFRLNVELDDSGPDKCVNCGACVKKCPQHLHIPEELEKFTAVRVKAGV